MSFNLMEMVKNYFTSEFTKQASSSLGEDSSGISKALTAILPTGLAGILNKATSGDQGANDILSMARNAIGSVSGSTDLTSGENINKGGGILSSLFGNSQSGIINTISNFAGIKSSSASSLMSMGLPAIMGLLGKHAEQNNLSASGLSGFLSSQKDHILNALPSGLSSITGLLGLGSLGATASSATSHIKSAATHAVHEIEDKPSGGAKWLLPLIIILAALALLWYFSRSCNQTKPSTASSMDSTAMVQSPDTSMDVASTALVSIKVKLSNGKELDAYKGGIEDQLVTFLSGDWKSLSDDSLKAKWFNFDDLNFTTGKATILPESEKQLDNLADILKAFPDAKLKIGGYTDASGDAAFNKKLSQDRADAAKAGLATRGVGAQVTGAEGYGSEFAKVAADAPDAERALDRHVSVSVRK